MSEPRLATTVLLLRPEKPEGFSVFMLRRHRKSGFLPHAWVFPGGVVDPRDRLVDHPAIRGGKRVVAHLGLGLEEGVAMLLAGVRETFEESGIWLGEGDLPEEARQPLARGEVSLEELLEAHDASIDLDRLYPWSWWITPKAEPKRYDTRILVAVSNGTGHHDDVETVDSGWFRPSELLAKAEATTFAMAPPTWWTLHEVSAYDNVKAVEEAAWGRPQRPIEPILRLDESGLEILLPGHPEHSEPAFPGLPTRVTFREGRWWADGEAASGPGTVSTLTGV
jgi:8-oxo-dGTP pyrophosphatase MutT (NUDIX family)